MKITDYLKNVVVRDAETNEELMNTSEFEPEVFEMFMDDVKDHAEEEGIIDKDVDVMEAACIFDDNHISNTLVEWAYFLSEGYEPDPNAEYLHGFPEVYVDEKEYLITIVDIDTNYSYTCETDIDTL